MPQNAVGAGIEDKEQAPFSKLSGSELIVQLQAKPTPMRAFYELWRRGVRKEWSEKDEGFEAFHRRHYDPEVVVCPQDNNEPTIYLVLYGYLYSEVYVPAKNDYKVEKPEEIFRIKPYVNHRKRDDRPAIDAFTADGVRVNPFGGGNVLQGVLADVNGDGKIERVEVRGYGAIEKRKNIQTLFVETVKAEAETLLAVLINWGADEWDFKLTDSDGDGISDIEVGTRTASGVKTQAVWKWDREKRVYTGPEGKPGDHFRVLDVNDYRKDMPRFDKENLQFPREPDAVPKPSPVTQQLSLLTAPPSKPVPLPTPPAQSGPYKYVSLKGATDQELFDFMGYGKREPNPELDNMIRSQLPKGFWEMDAKAAALAFIEVNRKEEDRLKFQIALDDRDKTQPPATCTIASNNFFNAYAWVDDHFFLHVDPKESYLASTQPSNGFTNSAASDDWTPNFRFCPLPYADALKIAHVIWWLDRVRSHEEGDSQVFGGFRGWTTVDGNGKVAFRSEGKTIIEYSGKLWAGPLSKRMNATYDHEAFLNFVSYLMSHALPERLGTTWTEFNPVYEKDFLEKEQSEPGYRAWKQKRINELTEKILSWFSADQEKISFPIVKAAVRSVGLLGLESAAKRLQEIEKADTTGDLRSTVSLVRSQLAARNDVEKLYAWVISKSEGHQWAAQRLLQLDQKRYLDALEKLLEHLEGYQAEGVFHQLVKMDRPRAVAIARKLPVGKKSPLTAAAFRLLSSTENIPDDPKQIDELIRVLSAPESEHHDVQRAIGALVPWDAPLRYPDRKIDEALLKLLESSHRHDTARVLARRGRTDLFSRIARQLEIEGFLSFYPELMGALVLLTQADPAQLNPQMLAVIRRELEKPKPMMNEVFWAIWSAGFQELKPDLERLATLTSDVNEDARSKPVDARLRKETGRYHVPRKIVAVWSEPDPLTRAKLLVALLLMENNGFVWSSALERRVTWKKEMSAATAGLSPEAKKELNEFIAGIEKDPPNIDGQCPPPVTIEKVIALVRESFP